MTRSLAIWAALGAACILPAILAGTSPQLAWRGPVYILAGFAGVIAMVLLLVQPLLIGGYLPGSTPRTSRRWHSWIGASLLALVVIHVGALWWTSPPDVVDALLFRSPTPFSDWGVIAMWAAFATGLLAVFRRRLRLRPSVWTAIHLMLAVVVILGSVVHAMLIEGTMETISKTALCAFVILAAAKLIADRKPWSLSKRSNA